MRHCLWPLMLAAVTAVPAAALAQGQSAGQSAGQPPVPVTAHLITTHRIPAALASEAVAAAVGHCASQGYAETAVLVDADGVIQASLRGDRAGSHTLDSARDKAYTAATFKADTLALAERAKTVPAFAALFTQLPHLILFGGGVVIKHGDEVIGAIGAAGAPGADLDAACAKAGIDAIAERLK
jgi:uncharacterized protein GlcG (DUF336 family)